MSFNSKLVRLKDNPCIVLSDKIRIRFNSKLVRLKARWQTVSIIIAVLSLFQFQTGSIKRNCMDKRSVNRIRKEFQFQTGSIKRHTNVNIHLLEVTWFQFQTGSIKRRARLFACRPMQRQVSIPNWFD